MNCVIDISRFFNQNLNVVWWIALFLGSWTVLAQVYRLIHFVYAKLIRKRKNFKTIYGENKWTLITGSSQGIGKAFALALAKQGFNIILTARTQSKLKQTQQQIAQQFPKIQVRYIVVDLIKTCDKQVIQSSWYKQHKLDNIDIRIVVNNAGIDFIDKINDLKLKDIIRMIQLDSLVVSSLNYLFLEKWTNQKKQNQNQQLRHLIINVSSLAVELPISYFSVYNAAKIYVDRLTQSIALQYPEIDFMALRPSEVSTKMTGFKKDIFTIQPYQCVQPLLDDIGYQNISHGSFVHAIQSWIYATIPLWLFNLLWEEIFVKEFIEVRKEFEQKKQ